MSAPSGASLSLKYSRLPFSSPSGFQFILRMYLNQTLFFMRIDIWDARQKIEGLILPLAPVV